MHGRNFVHYFFVITEKDCTFAVVFNNIIKIQY